MKTPTKRFRAILLVFATFGAAVTRAGGADPVAGPPALLLQSIHCLVAKDYIKDTLADIGLHPNDSAWVRYHRGSIAGFNPTPDEIQIAVYSRSGFRGWLLMAFTGADGRVSPIQNAYQLTWHRGEWSADEGNGGVATYRAMSAFANLLMKSPRYRITLKPESDRCTELGDNEN
jgi:hypothetical protein